MGIDQNLIFLEGNYVWLKVLSQSDISESSWVGWFNDEERNRYNTHHYWPNTYENQQIFLAQSISPSKIQLGIIDKKEPELICGVISLQQINLIDRTAEIATMMDRRTRSQPNIFVESWSLLLKHGFQELGLNKIYGGSINTRIPKLLCELFNFEIEGTLKKHVFKGGEYIDVIQSAVFRENRSVPKTNKYNFVIMESQQPKLLIVVPCYNEQTRFDLLYWKNVISSNPFVRFVFVNDGSSDETLRIIQEIGQASEVLSLEKNSGKSEAIRLGWLQYISESKWIGYGFIDSDGAFSPNDIQKLIEIFKVQFDSNSKVDVILSSRVALAGRKIERTSFRHYLGRIIATYISHNWPGSPYDTQSGFKLFIKTDCFRKAILEPFKTRWFFDIELLVRLKGLKKIELRIWEEPLMSWNEIANSKIKKYEFLRILKEIFVVKTIVRKSVRLLK